MKYIITLITTIFLLVPWGLADSRHIDSLMSALKYADSDTQKVLLYDKIAWEFLNSDLDKAASYNKKGCVLAEEIIYRRGMGKSFKTRGVIAVFQSDLENALKHLQNALVNFRLINDKVGEANTINNLGWYYQQVGKYKESLEYFEAASSIREEIGDKKGLANSCNNLGVMYYMLGKYDKSLQKHLTAIRLWEELKERDNQAASFLNIGAVYREMDEKVLAMGNFQEGLKIAVEENNLRSMADAHSNIGDMWLENLKYKKAINHYLNALNIREKLADKTGIRESLSSLGAVHTAQKKYHEAIAYHNRSLHIAKTIDDKSGMLTQYNLLGEVQNLYNKPREALSYLMPAQQLAKELGMMPELAKTYKQISLAYLTLEDYQQAFQFQALTTEVNDQIFSEEKTRVLEELKEKYESDQKEKEIGMLQKEREIAKLRQRGWMILSLALAMACVIGMLVYRYRIKVKNTLALALQKQAIEERNHALELSNADLEQFAYVVSHDLKQPLRTIGSFAGLISRRYPGVLDSEGKEFINYVTDGVKQMHNLLTDLLIYAQTGKNSTYRVMDMNEIIDTATKNLQDFIREKNASIHVEGMPFMVGNRSGMIQLFQNMISNAIKFNENQPPEIEIEYRDENDRHLIVVRDNGIGISADHKEKIFVVFQRLHTQEDYPGTGIGLSICQKVAKQHGGEIWIDSEPGKGSAFYISLPKDFVPVTHPLGL